MTSQRLSTVYTERFRVDCVHDDCGGNIIITVEREKGSPELTVGIEHEIDRLTTNLRESINGASRLRKQHTS